MGLTMQVARHAGGPPARTARTLEERTMAAVENFLKEGRERRGR